MARTKKTAEETPATEEITTHVEEVVESDSKYEFPEEEDMGKFWSDPAAASIGMQMKYIGMTPDQYKSYWDSLKDEEGACPEGFVEDTALYTNVYTHEDKIVRIFRESPKESAEETIDRRIRELKLKVAMGTATEEDKEALKLLIG